MGSLCGEYLWRVIQLGLTPVVRADTLLGGTGGTQHVSPPPTRTVPAFGGWGSWHKALVAGDPSGSG